MKGFQGIIRQLAAETSTHCTAAGHSNTCAAAGHSNTCAAAGRSETCAAGQAETCTAGQADTVKCFASQGVTGAAGQAGRCATGHSEADDLTNISMDRTSLFLDSPLLTIYNVLTSEAVIRTAVRELRDQLDKR